jgi:hypothetical protein
MNFTISPKAKKFLFGIAGLGVLMFIIGLATNHADLKTRLMSDLLINGFFFLSASVAALFFLALNYATESGWFVVVKRIIEGVASYIPIGAAIFAVVLLGITFMDGAGVYIWMDADQVASDKMLQHKEPYLNKAFFWIRTIVYLGIYVWYFIGFRKRSIKQDEIGGNDIWVTNYKKGAVFLVFFAVFSSSSSWDWIMSIDAHWFSTLFGWYLFAGAWCSGMIVMTLLAVYLKKNGYLEQIKDSHIHDLAKWVFATSFLWTYLWFSQFMLYWYSDIAEEVIYFKTRIDEYQVIFFSMMLINFVLPMVLLMSREAKRHAGTLAVVGTIVFIFHWVDVNLLVIPGVFGAHGQIGFMEIGLFCIFAAAFIFIILNSLTKAPLLAVQDPYLDESLHHEFL